MVEVIKIILTYFKRSHACTVALSTPNPAAGHHQLVPPLETPGHSWATLGRSFVGSLLPSPGSWCTQGFVCALQKSVSLVLCKFCNQIPLASKVKFLGGSPFARSPGWEICCESQKRQKDRTLKDEFPRSVGAQYTGEEWRNNSIKNEEMKPKQKQCPVVDVTGDGSKV